MRINEGVAITNSKVLLVPYEMRHVPIYHEWMKSEEIRLATASEPLSLAEEYNMQKSWRNDRDKLTFIACKPNSRVEKKITAGIQDSANLLLGDVNLFLSPAEEDPSSCIGELELMIAPLEYRRQGYGRAIILVFLYYLQTHLHEILTEYDSKNNVSLLNLRVKINSENLKSIKLFESIGFLKADQAPNYFGELEFMIQDFTNIDQTLSLLKKYNVRDYFEVPYIDEK
ncbi:N-acetyltransferase 9-like protein [Erysiphe neolycopersici]|uniref:N-acetyltransferase 9-like protein n=1 Tax=Erysiphe neolycopersici TaxID=212602 RepID=A0A420I0W4_9PEZI|nr:N-acetyltransferase 9-like protein [Erysiphe neolycopersici]